MSASRTLIIGLTGGIGSGKSEAARRMVELGAVHVDADAVSRAITAPGGEALGDIREAFGDQVFRDDGTLDRRALGEIVFSDERSRRVLEGIIHPRVQRTVLEMMDRARSAGAEAIVMDVPLLFETGMDALCDVSWVIQSDREERIRRVMARDGMTREAVEKRMESQMSDGEQAARATRVIRNDQSLERLLIEIEQLYNQLVKNSR